MKNTLQLLQRFLELESASGIVLFLATLAAVLLANSPWSDAYHHLWQIPLALPCTTITLPYPPLFWINEGLMTLFFFVVGLELKRELISSELADPAQLVLPAVAALGGMVVPALIYSLFNYQHPDLYKGWAIPVATDIAFAAGVLSLLGKRIPLSLRLFLMALAIFDDIGAILIIAVFYAHHFAWQPLICAILVVLLLFMLNRDKQSTLFFYIIAGFFLWFFCFQSGIHPTIAGVVLALMVPHDESEDSLLSRAEENLHAWVAYFIMPLFALANAGLSFVFPPEFSWHNQVTFGVLAGLFAGKQIGVFSFAWALIRLGYAKLPSEATWIALWGVSILCGIGFTMSLFLGTLAFHSSEFNMTEVRLGVFLGSMLSGIIGGAVLYLATRRG